MHLELLLGEQECGGGVAVARQADGVEVAPDVCQ
jgi:hypothetical protein